ncbi:MAG: hypothetical protein M0Z50_03315 [Planctomycetia bacterium]|nr:hypothetical protein [Planctomycetia bacterium]
MTEQPDTELQSVLTAILDNADLNKIALFASLQSHPLLEKVQTFARDGDAERFRCALPYRLESLVDGLLQTVLPGKREAHFILTKYQFIEANFKQIIAREEGFCCSADKSRTVLLRLLSYYLTGEEVVFDWKDEYTFGYPTKVFVTHHQIVSFFEALRSLYYGNPELYLKELQEIFKDITDNRKESGND